MRRRARSRTTPAARLLAAAAMTLCCGAGATFHLAEGAPPSSDFARLALLPCNFDRAPGPALAPGAEILGTELRSFLEAMGFEVVEPRMSTTIRLWRASQEAVGGIDADGGTLAEERYEEARSILVKSVLARFPADGAVAGTVMLRPGRYSMHKLSWDDVARPVPIENTSNYPVLALRGEDLGTSLRTTVFDADGRKIFERYVGLEPLRRYEATHRGVRPIRRTDLFQDAALLRQSVAQSFAPWVTPSAPEPR